MNDGAAQQVGTPDEVYHEPANRFVGGFIGSPSMNFIGVTLDDGVVSTASGLERFRLRISDATASRFESCDRFDLGVHPQYFEVPTLPTQVAVKGMVEVTESLGDEQIVDVSVESETAEQLELTIKASNILNIERGNNIWLAVRIARSCSIDKVERE